MSKKYIHKRRELILPSFPNNKLSSRPRKRKVEKQEWIEDDLTIYNQVPDSAVFTPWDVPNPTDEAPTLSDYWQTYEFFDGELIHGGGVECKD